ncbi:low molecular weight protein-tyrosine-phosphatase [Paraburkholderia domus]|jgi:Protein-tyrosine-phosphatase|uniref:protein-tyrosine-phosphatase n=1 Tax=Paraburkholderia domus TaxID=2793075 RepID=A0A9N8MKB5_9BURK|nr:low molecular weight protein-tyrosine-phosphatase [Paraburkholderia domus]MBK5049060.1 low molecular weight phosphotyrosine protein phosphatase [Burkholderia sp. R-70006]MBK5118291.1 low molecular weight phosphotyrosine protein phosphatase [Burkholderia sp. R-69980]MBK5164130.1 low molecular weight phosphotyrosine protein phosphatase [Burkholderia sp. R-70211]MBK5179834.1 low molecular weight phosphotyrosine protein phosphatase [Burkholderia sp. R-69749]MCI0144378.1 low molecular weight pho
MIKEILVVCEGNLCRSPMAAAFLASVHREATVISAGLNALVGRPSPDFARDVMRERGLPIDEHRAQQITAALCKQAELILVMDNLQRRELEQRYPFAKGKVYRVGEHSQFDVDDPYRQAITVFEHCAQTIETGINEWATRLSLMADRPVIGSVHSKDQSLP